MCDNIDERVERRVDELFNEFFTDCPYGRKAVSECPALRGEGKKATSDYASQFFNDCPYGKRAQKQCPYGRKLAHGGDKHPDYVDEFFTECPYGRKAACECPYGRDILEKSKKSGKASHFHGHGHDVKGNKYSDYVEEFFTECPYGKRATAECPYGREISVKAKGNKSVHPHHHGEKHPDYVDEFFTECPYGRKAAKECPYGQEILEKSKGHHHGKFHHHGRNKHPDYVEEFFTECPYGKRVTSECPHGAEILAKSKAHHHGCKHPDYVEEFFTECPYGKRITSQCPYGAEILAKSKKAYHAAHHHGSDYPNCIEEFFTECPYGRKAAEECPYDHGILEKAGIDVPALKKPSDEQPSKCPFANMAGADKSKCPVSGGAAASGETEKYPVSGDKKEKTAGKCPVGGVMPQSEKCPISPNYKKTLTPLVDFYETDNEFKLFVELPGVQKSDVKVDVKDKVLTLSAEAKAVTTEEQARFTERNFGVFSRIIPLPSNVAPEKIQAKMDNGVLTIIIPKGTPSVTKTITIN